VVVSPEGFSLRKTSLSRVENLMFTSYEGNKMLKKLKMFCCVEDNKIISCIVNTITELDWKG
jgi:hypothetical protein